MAISQATGGGASPAINLLLGYMPGHAIIQHRGIHPYPAHSPPCDLYFLRKQKMNQDKCVKAGITGNSHERFLGGMPRRCRVALALLCSD